MALDDRRETRLVGPVVADKDRNPAGERRAREKSIDRRTLVEPAAFDFERETRVDDFHFGNRLGGDKPPQNFPQVRAAVRRGSVVHRKTEALVFREGAGKIRERHVQRPPEPGRLVGAATAVVMWSTGVGDPVLWGTVAFILNYVPILGPAAAIFIFLFAGSLTIASTWQALLPAALYGAIHVIEGETVTPILLAKRFTLNPVFVVFSFVFWFWLWGVPGAILSAPILATIKLVCDRIRPLAALGHILAG